MGEKNNGSFVRTVFVSQPGSLLAIQGSGVSV